MKKVTGHGGEAGILQQLAEGEFEIAHGPLNRQTGYLFSGVEAISGASGRLEDDALGDEVGEAAAGLTTGG